MKRTDYEAPTMEEIVVEMKEGFLEASVIADSPRSSVKATGHEVGETFDMSDNGSNDNVIIDWDIN